MPDSAVVNASPLILLANAGYVDLLKVAARQILVPRAVAAEIGQRDNSDPTVQALRRCGWLEPVDPPPARPQIAAWDLGAGESAVLEWAAGHPSAIAVLDDRAARRCAVAMGISVVGTLGIILIAKRTGVISEARPVLLALQSAGFYISQQHIDGAVRLVGE